MRTLMIAAGLAVAVAAAPAAAQVAGVYSGTLSNGNAVSFTVSPDSSTGGYAITNGSVSLTTQCSGGGPVLNEGEGYGLNAEITNGSVAAVASYPSFYASFHLRFNANGSTARGALLTVAPFLDASNGRPMHTYTCAAPNATMTLTLQTDAAMAKSRAQAAGTADRLYVYDGRGRIVGTKTR